MSRLMVMATKLVIKILRETKFLFKIGLQAYRALLKVPLYWEGEAAALCGKGQLDTNSQEHSLRRVLYFSFFNLKSEGNLWTWRLSVTYGGKLRKENRQDGWSVPCSTELSPRSNRSEGWEAVLRLLPDRNRHRGLTLNGIRSTRAPPQITELVPGTTAAIAPAASPPACCQNEF